MHQPQNFSIENHGSVVLVRPLTESAKQELNDVVGPTEGWQWFGGALAVEPRYVEDILVAISFEQEG